MKQFQTYGYMRHQNPQKISVNLLIFVFFCLSEKLCSFLSFQIEIVSLTKKEIFANSKVIYCLLTLMK